MNILKIYIILKIQDKKACGYHELEDSRPNSFNLQIQYNEDVHTNRKIFLGKLATTEEIRKKGFKVEY